MKRCIIDPVLALEDEKQGKKEYRKVFRDAKLAIARAFKVIERFYYCLFAFHMSLLCFNYMFPNTACGALTHTQPFI